MALQLVTPSYSEYYISRANYLHSRHNTQWFILKGKVPVCTNNFASYYEPRALDYASWTAPSPPCGSLHRDMCMGVFVPPDFLANSTLHATRNTFAPSTSGTDAYRSPPTTCLASNPTHIGFLFFISLSFIQRGFSWVGWSV